MQDFTITNLSIQEKNSKGEELFDKLGRKYKRVLIQVDDQQYGGKDISHLAYGPDEPEMKLKQGETRKLIISQNGNYLNFKCPRKDDLIEERIDTLEKRVKYIVEHLGMAKTVQKPAPVTEPKAATPDFDQINAELAGEIPF